MRLFFSSGNFERAPRLAFLLVAVGSFCALMPGLLRGASDLPTLDGSVVRHASRILPERDGRVIAVSEPATNNASLAVVQFLSNGKLDHAFDASELGLLALDAITRLADGKILLAGSFANAAGKPVNRLVKLESDGSVVTGFHPGKAFGADLLVQSDERILLLASTAGADGVFQPKLTRLHSGGSVDTSFQAKAALVPGTVYALKLQADGKILLLGRNGASAGQASLERLESDGELDRQFHAAAPIAAGDGVCAFAFARDGKLLVAEYTDSAHDACTLSRLEADGALDPAFRAALPIDGPVDRLEEDLTGQVILSGAFTAIDGIAEPGFARLTNHGNVDATFDPLGNSGMGVYDFAVDPYGSVTFATPSGPDGPPGAVVETYSADGSAVTAYIVNPCPSCELVPAISGQEVYVRVKDDQATAAAAP